MSRYGQRLVALREARGLGPFEAARAIGITHETLRDAENGTRHPRQKTRQRIADFYGVDVDTLEPQSVAVLRTISTSDTVPSTSPVERTDVPERHLQRVLAAIEVLAELSPESRRSALNVLQLKVAEHEGKGHRFKGGTG